MVKPLRRSPRSVLATVLAGVLSGGLAALPQADGPGWPAWRGPDGTGCARGGKPPTTWSPTQNIAWKVPVPGLGISTPIVQGDRIYLTTAIATDRKGSPGGDLEPQSQLAQPRPEVFHDFVVLALDRRDGKVVWQRTVCSAVPHEGGHQTNSHASSSPVTDGGHLFVNFGSRGVYCLDLAGQVTWSKQLGRMRTRRQYGEASSPVVYGDNLVVNWDHEGDSFIVLFDKRTGEERWRRPRDEVTSWSTPIVVPVDGRPQIVINATAASRGYDLASGEVVWTLSGMTVNCIPIPIHRDGVVFLMSGYRGQMLQAVQLAGAKGRLDGGEKVLWSHQRNTSYVPSGLLHDGRLYFLRANSGVLSCLDAATGKVHYEGQRLRGLRTIYASPVHAGGHTYITSRDGVTMVIDDGPEFAERGLNRLDEPVDASLAVVGDAIYLRGHRHLYCIAHTDPAPAERRKEGSPSPGGLRFEPVATLGEATERTASLATGDLDGDGDLDIVVANGRHWPAPNRIFVNDGKGNFTAGPVLGAEPANSYRVALGDLDRDGDLDAVVANDRMPSQVFYNDGAGRFAPGPTLGIAPTRNVTLADLDGANGLDVIFSNRGAANLICFNDGRGRFPRRQAFGAERGSTIATAAADLDGDGDLDLVVANRDAQQNYVYLNDGKGGFATARPYGTGSDATRGLAIADLDGDGKPDLVNGNIGQPNAVYFGDGKGGFPRSLGFGGDERSYAVAVADLDGDRRLDVVVANVGAPNTVWLQRPDGGFTAHPFGAPDGITYGVLVADWDGDGVPEIATANSGGPNRIFRRVAGPRDR